MTISKRLVALIGAVCALGASTVSAHVGPHGAKSMRFPVPKKNTQFKAWESAA